MQKSAYSDLPEEQQKIANDFYLSYEDKYGSIYVSKQQQPTIFICQVRTTHIFDQDFKKLLHQCTMLAQKTGCEKFIIDMRKLHILQYNSMEWYYLHWKQMMYREFQLGVHRKLYLMEPWLLEYIEDCRKEIYKKSPSNICHHLDIRACTDLLQAINQ
ncbi:hypothetical protein [Rhodoflexus sp.]